MESTQITTKGQQGFSLIELLIVVAVIGIIASIAIPNLLASRRAANEGSAQSSLRTIHSAQITYQATTGAGAYAADLASLGGQTLIDSVLAVADQPGSPKSGYNCQIHEQAGTYSEAVYGAKCFPAVTNWLTRSGTRRFGLTEVGTLRGDFDLTTNPTTRDDITHMAALGN